MIASPILHHLLLLATCTLALGLLALAMARHQQDLLDRLLHVHTTRALRSGGWTLLGLALGLALDQWGLSIGLVTWSGHLSLATGLVYLGRMIAGRRKASRPY